MPFFSFNKAIIIGRIGKDCELRETTTNVRVATFPVATDHSFKKGDTWENKTTWHNIVLYNPSDYVVDYAKKGRLIGIEGRINTRDYVDKDNNKRYITEIIAENVILLEKKEDSSPNYEKYEVPGASVKDNDLSKSKDVIATDDDLPF